MQMECLSLRAGEGWVSPSLGKIELKARPFIEWIFTSCVLTYIFVQGDVWVSFIEPGSRTSNALFPSGS